MPNLKLKKAATQSAAKNSTKEGNTTMIHKTLDRLDKMIDEKVTATNEVKRTDRAQLNQIVAELTYLQAIERKAALDGDSEKYSKTKAAIADKEQEKEMLETRLDSLINDPLINDREHLQAVDEIRQGFAEYENQCKAEFIRLIREVLDLNLELLETKQHADSIIRSLKRDLCHDDSFSFADTIWCSTIGKVRSNCVALLMQLGEPEPEEWKDPLTF